MDRLRVLQNDNVRAFGMAGGGLESDGIGRRGVG